MAKIGTITYKGKSKTDYTFNLYPMDTSFSEIGAVYIVTKREVKDDKGTHTLLYVGQAEDMSTRFNDHHKQDCFDKKGGNCIGVHQLSKASDRDTVEEDLIASLNPPCNDQLKTK
jgi:hypothetical protein